MQKKERKKERKNKEPFLGSGAGVFNKKKARFMGHFR